MKRFASIILCLCMVVLMAGCSNKQTEIPSETETETEPVTEAMVDDKLSDAEKPSGPKMEETEPVDKTKVYEEPTTIRIAGTKGATSIGMIKMVDDTENGKAAYSYEFTSDADTEKIESKISEGKCDVAILPADIATALYNKTQGQVDVFAICAMEDDENISGVMVSTRDFRDNHPQALKAFADEYRQSVEWVNANVDDAIELADKYDFAGDGIEKKSITESGVVCITGKELTPKFYNYIQVLYAEDPDTIGGALPGPDFFMSIE